MNLGDLLVLAAGYDLNLMRLVGKLNYIADADQHHHPKVIGRNKGFSPKMTALANSQHGFLVLLRILYSEKNG